MTDVKSKRFAGGETFEAADRLHSAAIHLLRRLRVRDREIGVGPAQLSALSVLVLGGGPRSLGEPWSARTAKASAIGVTRSPSEDAV